jgi:hypothetical protein
MFIPKEIKQKLYEYRQLMLDGCLQKPCKYCDHLTQISEGYYTCKRIKLMQYLWPDYRKEIDKIDKEVSKYRR